MMRSSTRWLAGAGLMLASGWISTAAAAQTPASGGVIIPLYAAGTNESLSVPELRDTLETGETLIYDVSEPTLEMFRPAPDRANGTAMIVVPGGGFVALGYTHGGTEVARALVERGITAFVLKHRTIRSGDGPMRIPEVHMQEMELVMSRAKSGEPLEMPPFAGEPKAIQDGEQAMAIVRQRAREWGIDPMRIGVVGFSSGAYLAADLAIGPNATRPNFVGLIYGGLRTPVPSDAPPAFVAGAADDDYQRDDPILLYTAWRKAGASAELHVYERGGHGFDLRPNGTTSDHWFGQFMEWLEMRGLLGRT
ncbi:alpha/beta hydrolase [Xanthomonas nasturtii]|uniref:alpha/beta hydrolase n=1 Tax=Xanthomonas nasturtii TaxID=1843581 RepID=UPI002011D893|nr:alpha/beta hydrolase [Xanthomonas nasturtii]MCL1500221.1 alpha/beta hydrolase [Xanthomonas nasturtii]MCL1503944.1 alpha/beta hydrolase [Xanthomonas nasturtii]MCL1523792.1 alpha/beta hydrolase [Xanthomonas nasturtii]